ncbi:KxYKxGKxW signal peptide domain-containing protein [Lacticaseibacillus pantheris]
MYKQGKIWAFALISTLAIGAGTLLWVTTPLVRIPAAHR